MFTFSHKTSIFSFFSCWLTASFTYFFSFRQLTFFFTFSILPFTFILLLCYHLTHTCLVSLLFSHPKFAHDFKTILSTSYSSYVLIIFHVFLFCSFPVTSVLASCYLFSLKYFFGLISNYPCSIVNRIFTMLVLYLAFLLLIHPKS